MNFWIYKNTSPKNILNLCKKEMPIKNETIINPGQTVEENIIILHICNKLTDDER